MGNVKKDMKMAKVEVIVAGFGTHEKGAKLDMEISTAEACAKNKVVKILERPAKAKEEKEDKK